MSNNSLRQPNLVRLFVVANILLWGFSVPVHLALTFLCIFFVSASARKISLSTLVAWLLLLSYGVIVYFFGPCVDGIAKMIFSAAIMLLLLLALYWLSQEVHWDRPLLTTNEALALLCVITFASFSEYIFLLLGGGDPSSLRVGGLFLEPSHLALSATPLLIYIWLIGKSSQRLCAILIAGTLAFISYSSTLIILILLLNSIALSKVVLRIKLNPRSVLTLISYIAIVLGYLILANHDDTLLRLNDTFNLSSESNLSSLVYANGWQMLEVSLEKTNGLGLGLNAMGCNPRIYTEINEWLSILDKEDQNFNDGSFLLSKFGSEFGYIGVLLFFIATFISIRYMMNAARSPAYTTIILAAAWLCVLTVGGLIRSGGGYFSGPSILGIFGFLLIFRHKKLLRANMKAKNNYPSKSMS